MAVKIAVGTNKGGTLKTTTAVNLACAIADLGKKVCIIDMDPQGNASLSFGFIPDDFKDTIYDVMMEKVEAEEVIYKAHEKLDIYVIPSNDDMNYFTIDIVNKYSNSSVDMLNILKNKMKSIEDEFDFIIVDTPPSLDVIQINVMNYVDRIIIPYSPEVYSMRSIQMFLKRLEQLQEKQDTNVLIEGVLVTLYKPRTNSHKTNLIELYRYLQAKKIEVFEEKINDTVKVGESLFKYRQPAVLVNDFKHNQAVISYKEIARKLVEKYQ